MDQLVNIIGASIRVFLFKLLMLFDQLYDSMSLLCLFLVIQSYPLLLLFFFVFISFQVVDSKNLPLKIFRCTEVFVLDCCQALVFVIPQIKRLLSYFIMIRY